MVHVAIIIELVQVGPKITFCDILTKKHFDIKLNLNDYDYKILNSCQMTQN